MAHPRLLIIVASVRPTRIGGAVAEWFQPIAEAQGAFDVERADLRELSLPMMNEPEHPRLQKYVHAHTKRWSAIVDRSDAFVFVMPEYDFSPTASLLNAIQYLAREWAYKPVGFVNYGGVSAGLRSASTIRIICTANLMMPLPQAVSIPFAGKLLDKETGRFEPGEVQEKAAHAMLKELARWEGALKALRAT
jgi:NAD(P)H-dependent FMN reductase